MGAYPASVYDDANSRILKSILRLGITTFVCLQHECVGAWLLNSCMRAQHAWRVAPELVNARAHTTTTPPPSRRYQHERVHEWEWREGRKLRPYIYDAIKLVDTLPHDFFADKGKPGGLEFVHFPIVDCATAHDTSVLRLARDLSARLARGEVMYLHCWGGHGRTGTVVSIMLGLLYGLSAKDAMHWVQYTHDLRAAPMGVSSPQTETQRTQVMRVLGSLRLVPLQQLAAQAAEGSLDSSYESAQGDGPGSEHAQPQTPLPPQLPLALSLRGSLESDAMWSPRSLAPPVVLAQASAPAAPALSAGIGRTGGRSRGSSPSAGPSHAGSGGHSRGSSPSAGLRRGGERSRSNSPSAARGRLGSGPSQTELHARALRASVSTPTAPAAAMQVGRGADLRGWPHLQPAAASRGSAHETAPAPSAPSSHAPLADASGQPQGDGASGCSSAHAAALLLDSHPQRRGGYAGGGADASPEAGVPGVSSGAAHSHFPAGATRVQSRAGE